MSELFTGFLSVSQLAKTTGRKRNALQAELHAAAQTETPYGDVAQTMTIAGMNFPFINPFAFLHAATLLSARFAEFLQERRGDATCLQVMLYTDEVVPGNNLRPDYARAYWAVYWQFMEYPDWFRVRHGAIHNFMQIQCKDVARVPGGIMLFYI